MPGYLHGGNIFFEPGNPDHVFASTGTHGMYESFDKGKTWKELKDSPPFHSIQDIARYDNYVYFSTVGGGCFRKKVK